MTVPPVLLECLNVILICRVGESLTKLFWWACTIPQSTELVSLVCIVSICSVLLRVRQLEVITGKLELSAEIAPRLSVIQLKLVSVIIDVVTSTISMTCVVCLVTTLAEVLPSLILILLAGSRYSTMKCRIVLFVITYM